MDTVQTGIRKKQELIKQLFRELFLIQIELEKSKNEHFSFNCEVDELILTIDRLLAILIDLNESFEH